MSDEQPHDNAARDDKQVVPVNLPVKVRSAVIHPIELPPDFAAIIDVFPGDIKPTPQSVQHIPYLLELIRNHPRNATHSRPRQELMKAIRIIENVLPGLIAEAEASATAANAAGRTTDMDRFAEHMRNLQAATAPFSDAAKREAEPGTRRTIAGWWHGYAQLLAIEVGRAFHSTGRPVSPQTERALKVVAKLLGLAGVAIEPSGVREVLQKG